MVRDHNEDSFYVDPDERFFIVADGMGGHAAGEVASAMAVDEVKKALEAASDSIAKFAEAPTEEGRKAAVTVLENAVRSAHQAVFSRGSEETDKQGMGTTLDVVMLAGPEAFVAHVGDSRTYLLRDGQASQITTDHTVAEVLVIEGKLSAEEAAASPLRTILVNAIGVSPDVGVEMSHVRLRKGDQLLLCSDGLHDYFPAEEELAEYLEASPPDDALTSLIDLAKERGGHDNITGVVVDVVDSNAPELPEDGAGGDDVATRDTHAMPAAAAPDDATAATLPSAEADTGQAPTADANNDANAAANNDAANNDAANDDAKDESVPESVSDAEVSDGVPTPISKTDTLPAPTGDAVAPGNSESSESNDDDAAAVTSRDDAASAEPASKKKPQKAKKTGRRKNKPTLPLGVEVSAAAEGTSGEGDAGGESAPDGGDGNGGDDEQEQGGDWDDDAARKTEPMQTVAQPRKKL